jgi:Protein of unknown function (DUF1552)
MMKHQQKYSRRGFLRTVGAGAALLPLLESDPSDAACAASGVKRLFILVWPNGMLSSVSSWATKGETPASWSLPAFMASLAPYQNDLLLLDGIDYAFLRDMPGAGERTGHAAYPGMLTGAFYQTLSTSTAADIAGGPSVDQYIGGQLQAAGYPGLLSLNLGVFVQSTGHLSWRGPGEVVTPNLDPYGAFTQYVQGSLPPTSPAPSGLGGAGGSGAPARLTMQRSILDFVQRELGRFSGKVGAADRQRIAQHLDAVRQIEVRLDAGATSVGAGGGGYGGAGGVGVANRAGGAPGSSLCGISTDEFLTPSVLIGKTSSTVPQLVKLQMDLATVAFAADITRVVVLQIGDQSAEQLVFTNLGFTAGGPNPADANTGDVNGWSNIAKRNGAQKVVVDTWFQSQVAYMSGQMKGLIGPLGRSALDDGVLVGLSNMRSGLDETTQVPAIMVGSCGGYFKTGRSLALTGAPNNQLLVSLCDAMGTPVATFGEPRYGGELAALKG